MKCPVCDREAGERKFCQLHMKAYGNIIKKYDLWEKALGISWKEYLSEIAKNSLTGQWSREVTEYLIKTGEEPNGAHA